MMCVCVNDIHIIVTDLYLVETEQVTILKRLPK